MQAREFITASSAELIQRILDGHRVRHATHLGQLPDELALRIIDASDMQADAHFLQDPIQDDPLVGPVVRQVMEAVSRELEIAENRPRGHCHLIWRTTQERLLHDHSIVWYSPAQMNPGSCFD
jgi:hypothetical protein